MDLEGVRLSEIRQAEKDRYRMFSLLIVRGETSQRTMGRERGETELGRGTEANHERLEYSKPTEA